MRIRPLAVILAILTTKIRDVQRRDNPDLSCNIHWRNLYVSAGPKRGGYRVAFSGCARTAA